MTHFLIDLDTTVKTLLLDNDLVLALRESEFEDAIANQLFEQMLEFPVDKVTVITHNTLSYCLYKDSCVAFQVPNRNNVTLSSINVSDVKLIKEIADRCGITDVKFVDKIGYYQEQADHLKVYVDSCRGIYTCYAFTESGVDFAIATRQADETTAAMEKKHGMTEHVLGNGIVDVDNLMLFDNSWLLLDDLQLTRDLSVFAYAALARDSIESLYYVYDFDVLQRNVAQILSMGSGKVAESDPDILQVEELSDAIVAQGTPDNKGRLPVDKEKPAKHSKHIKSSTGDGKVVKNRFGIGALANLILVVGIVGIAATVALPQYAKIVAKQQNALMQTIAEKTAKEQEAEKLLAAYEYCVDHSNMALQLNLKNLTEIVSKYDAEMTSLSVTDDKIVAQCVANTDEKLIKLTERIAKKHPDWVVTQSEVESDKTISINIENWLGSVNN